MVSNKKILKMLFLLLFLFKDDFCLFAKNHVSPVSIEISSVVSTGMSTVKFENILFYKKMYLSANI